MHLQHDSAPYRSRIQIAAVPGGATRRPRKFGGGQQIVAVKAVKSTHHPAALAGQRLGGQGGSFAAAIGFAEEGEADSVAVQKVRGRE